MQKGKKCGDQKQNVRKQEIQKILIFIKKFKNLTFLNITPMKKIDEIRNIMDSIKF